MMIKIKVTRKEKLKKEKRRLLGGRVTPVHFGTVVVYTIATSHQRLITV